MERLKTRITGYKLRASCLSPPAAHSEAPVLVSLFPSYVRFSVIRGFLFEFGFGATSSSEAPLPLRHKAAYCRRLYRQA